MRYVLIVLILLSCSLAQADQLVIPFGCYPKELQEDFAKEGHKLDLDGNDRDKDSWGFLRNEGNQYVIYTYLPVNKEEFQLFLKIILKNARGQNAK